MRAIKLLPFLFAILCGCSSLSREDELLNSRMGGALGEDQPRNVLSELKNNKFSNWHGSTIPVEQISPR